MKKLHMDHVLASFVLASAALLSVSAWSMEVMSDGQLAQTTGRDGLTVIVALPSNKLTVGQVALYDGNGFAGQTGVGAIVLGQNANGLAVGAAPTLGAGVSLTTNKDFTAVIDASGGNAIGGTAGTAPLVNIAVSLPTVMTLETGDVGVAAATGVAGSYRVSTGALGNANTGVIPIMKNTSMTFNLAGSPLIKLQLGNSQGSMLQLTSLNISSIVFNSGLSLVSPNGGVASSEFKMTPTLTNLNLSGAGIGVYNPAGYDAEMGLSGTAGGVIFKCDNLSAQGCSLPPTAGFNATLADVTVGNSCNAACAAGAIVAKGMPTAPLGSFGATGVTVETLRIGVRGM